MLRNYLRVALRNIKRHKGYTVINVSGLAVAIACCLLIGRWVQSELSYDEFHTNAERTYRVIEYTDDGWESEVGMGMAPLMAKRFPATQAFTRMIRGEINVSRAGHSGIDPSKFFEESNFAFVDSTFFDVFSFPLAKGSSELALSRPGTVVLTQEMAAKYFGSKDPVGKTLILHARREEHPLTVTGVLEKVPGNTHLKFDFLSSMGTYKQLVGRSTNYRFQSLQWPSAQTYVLLGEQGSAKGISERLPALVERRGAPSEAANYDARLQPITSIHLQDLSGEVGTRGSRNNVYVFSAIAFFILLLACINFINLSTARSARRAREVGVRKTFGARREQLIGQFLGESMALTFLALAAGAALAELLLPVFNAVSGRSLMLGYATNSMLWIGLAAITLFVGLIAGGYPAFVLSSFRPAKVLGSGSQATAVGGGGLRKGLVVFQFAISIALIAGALIVYQQFDFMQNTRLGFEEENVMTMPASENYETLKKTLRTKSSVRAVAGADVQPGFGSIDDKKYETAPFARTPGALADRPTMIRQEVDYGFFKTMDLEIVAGRAFSDKFSDEGRQVEADTMHYFDDPTLIRERAFVINESAAERLGWTSKEALGKKLRFFASEGSRFYFDVGGSVVGVVEDYHAASLREKIKPMAFSLGGNEHLLVKMVSGDNAEGATNMLRTAWEEVNPQLPFEASFLEQDLENLYRAERRLSRIISFFALVAVGVACLGLFGLAAYNAERRAKEISIRKVLGASVPSIVTLMARDFIKLVLLAFAIAVPVAYLAMGRWLQDFAYRIELGLWIFIGAGAVAVVTALASVSYHTIKAAYADPVSAIRNEG